MSDFLNGYNFDGINLDFTPEEVKEGWHLKLINLILDMNEAHNDCCFGIVITSDGYSTIVRATRMDECQPIFVGDEDVILTKLGYGDNATYVYKGDEESGERYNLVPIVENVEYDT